MRKSALPLLLLAPLSLLAQSLTPLPTLPASRWQLVVPPGNQAELIDHPGCLEVKFDVEARADHQIGHQALKQGSFELLLREPVALPPEAARIVFEAFGHQTSGFRTPAPAVQFMPLLADASGERLAYSVLPYPHLRHGAETWGRWMTTAFFAAEAGGATQDVFEAEGGDGNAWPDGQLRFLGFQVVVRCTQPVRRAGRIALSQVEVAGTRLPSETPYLYASSVLQKPGQYRIAATVANEFQGLPGRELAQSLTFSPEDLDSGRRRWEIPLGPPGNYWVSYQVTDAAGQFVSGDQLRHQLYAPVASSPWQPADPAAPPVLGYLRVNPLAHTNGVYAQGEPLTVSVRVFPTVQAQALDLSWSVQPYRFPNELQRGQARVDFAGRPFVDVPVEVQAETGRDAYRLVLKLAAGGTTLDQTTYYLGRRSDLSQPRRTRQGRLMDRDYVKQGAYNRITYLPPEGTEFKSEAAALQDFATRLDTLGRMTRFLTYMIDLRDFEVLPGVFDLALVDGIMDAAADRGVALTVRLAHADAKGIYLWQPYERQVNYDGTEINVPFYGAFSLTDRRYTDMWLRAYRALFDRYRLHPGFQGYYLMEPAGEATVCDQPWAGRVAGYEPSMGDAFRAYLCDELKLSLEQLHQRWGRELKSWDQVQQPLPNFQLGPKPDLRPDWVDFCRFKDWLRHEGWFPRACRAIRAYDPNHVVITYCAPTEVAGLADYGHNGGNHFLKNEGKFVDAWEKSRTGWITEPHHPHNWAAYGDPAEKGWVLDWSVWVMTAQAAGGGANLHVYYHPRTPDLLAHYGGMVAHDRFQRYLPIMEELHDLQLVPRQPQVAVVQGHETLWTKHRSTFLPRLDDLCRWFELAKLDSVRFEPLDSQRLSDYKLLLPNLLDETLGQADIAALDRGVREFGARLVVTPNVGKYCPERPTETFALLRTLGIAAPTGKYVQNQTGVSATVTAANPLFPQGRKLGFFSLADLRRDLQSPRIRESFWTYTYRWIPQSDYFGYYPGQQPGGAVWATFPDGGAALTRHQVGKGEVLVFWGLPDYQPEALKGFMARVAAWAGVHDPAQGAPIPCMLEGWNAKLGRRYLLLYQETPGTYDQPFPSTPDGNWFVEELVGDQRLGTWTGADLRAGKLPTVYVAGASPLKILRLTPSPKPIAKWQDKYPMPPAAK